MFDFLKSSRNKQLDILVQKIQMNMENNYKDAAQMNLKEFEELLQQLEESGKLVTLPASLQEIAKLRLQYPHASLTELGMLMDPPLGKSGVNHRLRRLMTYLDE